MFTARAGIALFVIAALGVGGIFDGPEELAKARPRGVDHDLPAPARR